MSLSSFFESNFNRNNRRKNGKRPQNSNAPTLVELLENRVLLSAEMPMDISALSDEFDDSSSINDWQRVNEVEGWNAEQLNIWDVNKTQNGRMVMQPHTVVWYQDWRGPMAFKEVTGDFVITTEVHVTDRDDIGNSDPDNIPSDGQYSLGGVMVRTPREITDPSQWAPGSQQDDGTNDGENYVFLSFGYAFSGGASQFGLELKTTRNSNSELEVLNMGTEVNTVKIQTARIGDTVITMYQRPGEEWQVRERIHRPDMPETLQVGLVTYTDWGKASDFDQFFHNGNALIPGDVADPSPGEEFNPDLTAGFEYARFVRPEIPIELQGADLMGPAVTDAQLLNFLGDHANIAPNEDTDPATVSVSALTTRFVEGEDGGEGFLITRESESVEEPLTVNFILEGDAGYGLDYTASSTISVVIPAGETSTTLFLNTIDDVEEETVEEIRLRLLTGTGYTTNENYQATVQLRDDDTKMEVGTNLARNVDWDAAWIFKDAFLRGRTWRAYAVNAETGQRVWQDSLGEGPEIQVDENGWIAELPTWTATDGTVYQQTVRTTLFTNTANRATGIYRAEWDGTGELQMNYVIETGVTAEGRNYALVDMPEEAVSNYLITINSTDPTDPIRNINFWMPDYNGESMVMPNWQPGDSTSPFHPLFIERLSGFESIRFMDWQTTNYNGELDLWEERSQITDASQANMTGDYDTVVSGIALEYMIQLANELGAIPWFNMPHQASDDFVENFATTVRDTLDPELDVYVEWSNELWNSHFPTFHYIVSQMNQPENEGLNFFQVATNEIRQDFQIWSDVFEGQEDRLVRIVAGQQNNAWVIAQLLANMEGEFDAISSTAYFGLSSEFIENADETTTADEIIDSLLEISLPEISDRLRLHQSIAEQYSEDLGRDIKYLTYESGSHVFEYNTQLFGSPAEAAGVEAMYSPRMYEVYEYMLNEVRDIGIDQYNEFIFTGIYGASPYGNYGLLHDMEQPTETAHQYRALLDFIATQNQAPEITVDDQMIPVLNNTTASNTGTVSDPNSGDNVSLAASVGTVFDNLDGTWSWSFTPTNGEADSQTVTITATDSSGLQSEVTFALTVDKLLHYVEDFNDEQAGLFEPGNATHWTVTDQQYRVDTSNNVGLGITLVNADSVLPPTFEVSVELTSIGGPNRWHDGFIIFDYVSETDFKYAGTFVGQNQWVIGHYQGHWGNRIAQVDWDDSGRSVNTNQDYTLHVRIEDNTVQLMVDNEVITTGTFATALNAGQVGLAAHNAVTHFDNFQLGEQVGARFPHSEDFNDQEASHFSPNDPELWNSENNHYEVDSSAESELGLSTLELGEPLPSIFGLSVELTSIGGPNRWHDGFIIFDYKSETDFKYAGTFVGQNQWVIGHYQGHWGNRIAQVDWDDSGRSINTNQAYVLDIHIDGGNVELIVDGEQITSANFGAPVNTGQVGLAAHNAVTRFDNFMVTEETVEAIPVDNVFAELDSSPIFE